jgi:hypothetical protein
MDTFEQLRIEATQRRDEAITAARNEYNLTVKRINALRRQMTGQKPATLKTTDERTIGERVFETLPRDRIFTVPQVVDLMHASYAGCRFKTESIRAQFPILAAKGAVRKVCRKNGQVWWAARELETPDSPFGAMTVADICEQLFAELGPMRVTEVVLAMRERGYRLDDKPQHTAAVVLRALTRYTGRFERGGDGRWSAANS